MKLNPVIFIQGPTASGKTDLAITLAKKINAIVVNCDSVQAYKKIDIGSAKPTREEMAGVPHELFDFINPPEELTAGTFREYALEVIFNHSDHPIVFVGGSGFYFLALEKGMFNVKAVNEKILKQIKTWQADHGDEFLFKKLQELDFEGAKGLQKQDVYRVIRSLSLVLSENKPLKEIQNSAKSSNGLKNPLLKLGLWLERKELEPIVTERTDAMFNQGLIQEVQTLVEEGLQDWAPLKSVGYKEVVSYLNKEISLDQCKSEIIKNTLRLAKKQRTWFKRDKEIKWFNPIEEKQDHWHNVIQQVSHWLRGVV